MTLTKTEQKLTKQDGMKQVKLIDNTFLVLYRVFDGISWGNYGKNYFKENQLEEKSHRGYKPENIKCFLSVNESARLFFTKQLIEYLFTENKPSLEGYYYCRKSIYTAYSLAKTYKKELMEALNTIKDFNYQDIINIDYAKLQELGY